MSVVSWFSLDDLLGELEHLGCGLGVERGGVLVEEQQLGLHQRGHQQRKRLALAAGEQAGLGGEPVFKAEVQSTASSSR